jgi:hypothetical protein
MEADALFDAHDQARAVAVEDFTRKAIGQSSSTTKFRNKLERCIAGEFRQLRAANTRISKLSCEGLLSTLHQQDVTAHIESAKGAPQEQATLPRLFETWEKLRTTFHTAVRTSSYLSFVPSPLIILSILSRHPTGQRPRKIRGASRICRCANASRCGTRSGATGAVQR